MNGTEIGMVPDGWMREMHDRSVVPPYTLSRVLGIVLCTSVLEGGLPPSTFGSPVCCSMIILMEYVLPARHV
jgi:hypothetical protein